LSNQDNGRPLFHPVKFFAKRDASERVKEFADAGDGVPPRPEFSGFLGHFGRVAFHRDRFQQFFHGFSVMRWVGRARRFNLFSDLGPAKTLDAEGESR
jgi:hypothetical protein